MQTGSDAADRLVKALGGPLLHERIVTLSRVWLEGSGAHKGNMNEMQKALTVSMTDPHELYRRRRALVTEVFP